MVISEANVSTLFQRANVEMNNLFEWFCANGLSLISSKWHLSNFPSIWNNWHRTISTCKSRSQTKKTLKMYIHIMSIVSDDILLLFIFWRYNITSFKGFYYFVWVVHTFLAVSPQNQMCFPRNQRCFPLESEVPLRISRSIAPCENSLRISVTNP